MEISKHNKRRIWILVKAFPQSSTKYEETVCCAGVTEDSNELLRLYPVRFRRLEKSDQFKRFDLVEMTITKASDPRPESYRVDEDSIRIVKLGNNLKSEDKVRLWSKHIALSLKELENQNKSEHRSLGIIKPDLGSLRFKIEEASKSGKEEQDVANLVYQTQSSLLEDPLKPIKQPKYNFRYQFTCDGHPHNHLIHDWEVQAAFINYTRQYGSEYKALEMMENEYQNNIPNHNLHFIMGTMIARPHQFIVIGLLRSTIGPEEVNNQQSLFDNVHKQNIDV